MSEFQQGLTFAGLMLRALARWGGRVAFSGHGGSFTYAQCLDLVGRYQAVMQGAGAARGQRIALLNANRAEAWLAGVALTAAVAGLVVSRAIFTWSLRSYRSASS